MFKPENALRNAKITILIVVIITVVNIGLLLNGILFGLPYALYSPQVFAFYVSYSLSLGDILSAMINFAFFFLITGTFIYTYTSLKTNPKIILLAFIVFLVDTLYCLWMMYRPAIFDPWVILSVVVALLSLFILNKYQKQWVILSVVMLINFVLLMVVVSDINRTIVMFDLIFKLWILVSLGFGVTFAYDKENHS